MNIRSGLAVTAVIGMSFFVTQPAFAAGNYNGGSGNGLCCDETTPTTPAPVALAPVVPVAAAPVAAAPAAQAPAAQVPTAAPAVSTGTANVLGESIEIVTGAAPAAAVIAQAPLAIASAAEQAPISFTGANSIAMTGGAAALMGVGVALVVASRRKQAARTASR